jgi:DNA helicase HerA-like ATPase
MGQAKSSGPNGKHTGLNRGLNRWEEWDGWIPTRDVEVARTSDEEVFSNATRDLGHPLYLGQTLAGQDFFVEGQHLEKVNVITGVKGSGKSHLSKVILLQLIAQGAPCIVFDINKEYIHLPKVEVDPDTNQVLQRGIVHLEAGGNFRLGVRQFGLAPLMTLLQRFGLPEVSALYFENRLARLWAEAEAMEGNNGRVPYIGLEQLIQMAEQNEFGSGSNSLVVNQAIRSRLEALKNTRIFARTDQEAASLRKTYRLIREGGALVIDVSALSNLAREGFVQAIIELVKGLCIWEIEHDTHRFPFIFFEEAHLYVSRKSIDYIVTRARHLGMTSFFVTNMIHGLEETILRQADNLFLLRIPFEDDVRHVSRGAAADYETMAAFVRRLRQHHAMVIGNVTSQYPLMFKVDPLAGVNTAGETRYFFRSNGVGSTEKEIKSRKKGGRKKK